jgi:hypothetical protein
MNRPYQKKTVHASNTVNDVKIAKFASLKTASFIVKYFDNFL